MGKGYSIDLRKKIVESYENKEGSIRKTSKRFKVSKGFVFSILKKLKETGTIYPKPHGKGRNPSIKPEGETFIRKLIEKQPDLILEEICIEYNKSFEYAVTRSTIDRTLKRMNITRKKKRCLMVEKTLQRTKQD